MLSNHEIMTLAVYLLGGESRYIDTEDVAIKANEIAPGRFTWRKYPNQISEDAVSKGLWDAARSGKVEYLIGSEKKGWLLSPKGLSFAKERVGDLGSVDLSRKPMTPRERRWYQTERTRMLAEEAFIKFQSGRREHITDREAEAFFRVDDYVVGRARERKIARIVNTYGDDSELGQAVQHLVSRVLGR
jgi:hypothetical protein